MTRLSLTIGWLALATAMPAAAQDAARVQPRAYRLVLENAKVRVLEHSARPGFGVCGTGRHSHPEHLTVLLTPARVRVKAGGRTEVHELPQGASFWEEAATHEVENIGGRDVRTLIVEVKPQRARR